MVLAAVATVILTLVACLGALTATATPAPAAPVAVRAWAGYPFLAGQVCHPDAGRPDISTPLVTWQLGSGVPPAFLTSPVTASNGAVSAAPPLAEVGPQSHGAVAPSPNGLPNTAAIAQYAALLERFGAAGNAAVAQVAVAVLAAFGGDSAAVVRNCVDQAAEQALLSQAADLAGPYGISFGAHADVVMGTRAQVAANVTSANGKPVPGALVRLSAGSRIFDGPSAQTSVRTDAAGTATVSVLIPSGTSASSIGIRAEVSVDTGLTAVTAQAGATTANPSGAVTAAVYPSDPVTAAVEQQLVIEPSAHPVLAVSNTVQAGVLGTAFTPRAAVSGMNGHAGTITFTTRGPVPLVNQTLCASVTAGAVAAAPVIATSTAPVVGDATVSGTAAQPAAPGCYLATATLATTDATPAAAVVAVSPQLLTVLDTTASVRPDHTVIGRAQPITGGVVLANLHGASAAVRTTVTAPRPIGYDETGCGAVDYSGARATTTSTNAVADARRANDGGTAATSTARFTSATSGIGCSRITVTLVLHVDGAADIVIPFDSSSSVLSIDPTISMSLAGDSAPVQGTSLPFLVEVNGTFSQPAHVGVTMVPAAASSVDCYAARYDYTAQLSSGPPVVVPAAEFPTATADSAPLGSPGCYRPVAVLTMDANHSITVTSTLDPAGALAVGPNLADAPPVTAGPRVVAAESRSALPAGIGFGLLSGLAVIIVLLTALRSRHLDV